MCKCNVVVVSGGHNFSLETSNGEWIARPGRHACNQPAALIGKWHHPGGVTTFLYLCTEHAEYYKDLGFEPHIDRGWFKLIGKVAA